MTLEEKVVKDIYNGQCYALWNEVQDYSVGAIAEDSLGPKTIEITGCERIILKDKSLNFQFELTRGKIEDFDEIIINGITFKRATKTAKAEAYKEFAERLKEKSQVEIYCDNQLPEPITTYRIKESVLDNLLKEMGSR